LPSAGWHIDETTGALMRDVIHRMGRRAFRWDYCGKGAYLITMTLADRSRPLFGQLVGDSAEAAAIELSPFGREIDAHLRRIGEHAPEIEVLAAQLMPEHLHAVLRVRRRMEKPLGIALRGFKGGAGYSRPVSWTASLQKIAILVPNLQFFIRLGTKIYVFCRKLDLIYVK
jgi:hypothetical protein